MARVFFAGWFVFLVLRLPKSSFGDGSCKLGGNEWISAGSQGCGLGACRGRIAGTATKPNFGGLGGGGVVQERGTQGGRYPTYYLRCLGMQYFT